jgi:predicted dehydrogenase
VEAFVHSVLSGEPPPVDGREGFRSLAACVAADESAAAGRPVAPASADF